MKGKFVIFSLSAIVLLAVSLNSRAGGRRGSLKISSITDGARVYIDGKYVGNTPLDKPLGLKPGKHKLKATRAGYGSAELEFTIRSGRTTKLEVDLLPFSGLVKFTANLEGAEVYVDNNLVGHTPLIRDVVAGDHKVLILKEGFNDYESGINPWTALSLP